MNHQRMESSPNCSQALQENPPRHTFTFVRGRGGAAKNSQSGFSLILTTLSLVVLIGFVALAIDVAYLEHVKRRMQSAADAAALAGAHEIVRSAISDCSDPKVSQAALDNARLNGFENGKAHITVTPNCPPTAGPYAGLHTAIEVVISQSNQQRFFIQVVGGSEATVAARAVGHLGSGDGCLISLSPHSSGGLTISGTADIDLGNCMVMVNSDDCKAMIANGGAQITAGGYNVVAGGACDGYIGDARNYDPFPPSTGIVPAPDPLAKLAAPAVSTPCMTFNPAAVVPGTYCGISISGGTVNFAPGMYVINGGGLKISGGNITGTGVTFFLTADAPKNYSGVDISGNAVVDFSAPTSGTYSQVLFYQDRTLDLTQDKASYNSNITGGGSSSFKGIFYFPTSNVSITGTTSTEMEQAAVIGYTIKLAGTPNLGGNLSALPGGPLIKLAVLGE